LITTLVESVPTLPLMLICLYRPEQAQAEESVAAMARRVCPEKHIDLYLHELTPVESQQLIASLLATEQLPETLRQLMLDKGQGNPFFLEEWVRALMDAGVLYQEDGRWQAGDSIHGLAVPESVQSVSLSRVDRLGTIPKQALQMAAVLGRIFRLRVLDTMTGSHPELAAALNHLQRQGFIYVERSQPDIEYSFHHVLAQNAIYQDLPKPRRVAWHRDAGQALERIYGDHLQPYIEDLARHYDQSDLTDKAIFYLLQAGQKAQQSTLNREALTYFQQALARIERLTPDQQDPRQRLDAVRGIGEAYAGLGDLSQGEPYLRQAIQQAETLDLPPAEQAQLYVPLCHLLRWSGRFEDLFHLSRTGLELLGDDDESAEAVVLVAFVAVAAYLTGRRHQYRQLIGPVVPILNRLPYGQHLFSAYGMASWWYRDAKHVAEATAWIATLAAEAEQRNDLWTLGYLRSWPGYWLPEAVGDLDAILSHLQAALAIAEQIGDQVLRGYVLTFLGLVHWAIGNMDLAERMQREALTIHEQGKALHMQVLNRKGLGLIYLSRGDWTRAMETFARGWDDAKQIHYLVHGVRMTLLGLARAYLMQGRRQEAIPLYCKVAIEDEADADGQIWMACALAGLAEAIEDPSRLREVYRSIQTARSPADPLPLAQWWLEPCTPDPHFIGIEAPAFPTTPESASSWHWHDPFGDCRWSVNEGGLTIYASNFFRDLWFNNQSAPRFLCEVTGDFAIQTVCTAAVPDRPAMGGIVLWHDKQNYLRLAWGAQGAEEITMLGCLDNRDLYLGRGRLPGLAVHLRLERKEGRVRALCSADGIDWFCLAHVPFPADGPVQIGPFATGMQFSWVHPGSTQRGTAIRFSSFQIWRGPTPDRAGAVSSPP
jgi:tetratricopeptide (TPR) repeat protein/regulation of enolase protein 1 (concanavalin A-like superfamily)